MKRMLFAIVLVFAMAIPAFAQSGQFGPIKFKLLMVWSENAAVVSTSYFHVGEAIRSRSRVWGHLNIDFTKEARERNS